MHHAYDIERNSLYIQFQDKFRLSSVLFVSCLCSSYDWVCLYAHVRESVCICVYVCECVYMYVYVCVCLSAFLSVSVLMCVCVCVCLCMCVCVCMCVCMYLSFFVHINVFCMWTCACIGNWINCAVDSLCTNFCISRPYLNSSHMYLVLQLIVFSTTVWRWCTF